MNNINYESNKKLGFSVNDSIYNGRIKVPSILFDPVMITKSNMEETILSDGLIRMKDLK